MKKQGTAPILNEQMVLDYLTHPSEPQSIAYHQSAAMMAIVDMRDRGITREEFVNGAANALSLHTAMGRLDTLLSIKQRLMGDVQEEPAMLVSLITSAITGLFAHANVKRVELHELMKRIAELPTERDAIN